MHTLVVGEASPGVSVGTVEVPLLILPDDHHAPPEDYDGGPSGAPLGLGLLIAMVSAALAIAIIALLISKMRRRQNTDSTDIDLEVPTDPYVQAIMFPTEPRPEWHRHLRQVINKAGQKIFKKGEPHETTIPENLRHQLKHIYVY